MGVNTHSVSRGANPFKRLFLVHPQTANNLVSRIIKTLQGAQTIYVCIIKTLQGARLTFLQLILKTLVACKVIIWIGW